MTESTLEVRNPWDQSTIESVEAVGTDGVEAALATARALADDPGAALSIEERVAVLERTRAAMIEQRDFLALQAAREGGKPLVDSLVETDRAIDGMRLCVEAIHAQHGDGVPMGVNPASEGRIAFTRHEPIGVVLAFSAFNHPLNLIVHQVAPAVAAGCPVIVKPAESTPLSCQHFVRMLHEAGLPDGWCQALLARDFETAGVLASDPRVDFFSFIGSAEVGWMLRSRLAPGTRCMLENGGAAPVVICEDADLDDAVPLLTKGGFYHAGQVCVSVQRVFAPASIARNLADQLAEAARTLSTGDPTLPDTDVGPLIRPSAVDRVHEWVAESGGAVLCGGKPVGATAYAPTVLFDPDAASRISTHEVFGPVVSVYPVENLDEALQRANALRLPFQAAVFGRDIDRVLDLAHRLDAAAVMINDHTAFRVDWMPFGGHGTTGLGTGGIAQSMRAMQREKLVVIRSPLR